MSEQTEREVLEALARTIWEWDECPAGDDPDVWVHRWVKLNRMLDAGAYLDAAMMLVPEGFSVLLAGNGDRWLCDVHSRPLGTVGEWYGSQGATAPALALCAAIRAARDAQHG